MKPTKEQLADPKWWDEHAPEGAMYWGPDTPYYCECFYKESSGVWYFASPHNDWEWRELRGRDGPRPDRMKMLIQRVEPQPTTWSGQGLPPVGTVCEFAGGTRCPEDPFDPDLMEGMEVTIIAHFKDGDSNIAAFTFNPRNLSRGNAVVEQGMQGCFRPVRTPEQIAAEEREKAVDEMVTVWKRTMGRFAEEERGLAAMLYDAGYRKVEGGEK